MKNKKNTTLFAGAGFSRAVSEKIKYCGDEEIKMPLGKEMFNNKSSKDYLGGVNFLNHEYSKLGKYLDCKYGSRTPEINYEVVYGELLKDKKENYLAEVLEDMVFEILGVNFPPIRLKPEAEQTIKIIREFLLRENISQIITTNPDILLDVAIMGATEFDDDFLKLIYKPDNSNKFIIDLITEETKLWQPVLSKKESFDRFENVKRFVKLHGSITMALKNKDKENKEEDKLYWQSKYKWNKGISSAMYKHSEKYKLCVIPPSPKKRYSEFPWKNLMKEAKEIISNTDKLIFYGFGFAETDESLGKELKGYVKKEGEIHIIDIISDKEIKDKVSKFLEVECNRIKVNQIQGL